MRCMKKWPSHVKEYNEAVYAHVSCTHLQHSSFPITLFLFVVIYSLSDIRRLYKWNYWQAKDLVKCSKIPIGRILIWQF